MLTTLGSPKVALVEEKLDRAIEINIKYPGGVSLKTTKQTSEYGTDLKYMILSKKYVPLNGAGQDNVKRNCM